jgi:hypothetical protein
VRRLREKGEGKSLEINSSERLGRQSETRETNRKLKPEREPTPKQKIAGNERTGVCSRCCHSVPHLTSDPHHNVLFYISLSTTQCLLETFCRQLQLSG